MCGTGYMSKFIRLAKESSLFSDFNNRNKLLTAKLLKQSKHYKQKKKKKKKKKQYLSQKLAKRLSKIKISPGYTCKDIQWQK